MNITTEKSRGNCWLVKLDGKQVGQIVYDTDGFTYFPKGYSVHGDSFRTLSECVASLKGN
jgi:hypothetical protein